jgi:tetratricopeptide (TPR) repeat protein
MAKGPAKKVATKAKAKSPAKSSKTTKAAPKPAAKPVAKTAAKPAAKPVAKPAARASAPVPRMTIQPPPPMQTIKAPSADAITAFERGMSALQRKDYKTASTTFQLILDQFPAEGFLTDRARVYIELAARELRRQPAGSGNVEQRLTAATHALNNHNDEEAARLAADVLREDGSQDLAAYLLAVVAARRNDIDGALAHLRTAIAINPECRLQARQDEEFDPLMDSDDFHALIEAPAAPAESSAAAPPKKPIRKPGR